MLMTFSSSVRARRLAVTVAAVGVLSFAAPATASADQVDDILNALPAGQITCEQAQRYWTDEADYNSKVTQANALALFDSRGPQIKAALARVDEAANRCGLKGGGAAATGNNAGTPTFEVQIPGVGGVKLPDLNQISMTLREDLLQFFPRS